MVAPEHHSTFISWSFTVALLQKWCWRRWCAPWLHLHSWIHFHFHEVSQLPFHFHRNDADVVGVRHGCSFTGFTFTFMNYHGFTFTFMNYHSVTFTFTETMLMSLVCATVAASPDSLSLSWIITVSLSLSWIITVSLSLSQKRCWCRWCAPRLQLHRIHWRQLWWKELLTFSWWHRQVNFCAKWCEFLRF